MQDGNMIEYLAEAAEKYGLKYGIKDIGQKIDRNIPYAALENGLIFYGLPLSETRIEETGRMNMSRDQEMAVRVYLSLAKIIRDIEFRYFQTGRPQIQHSRYQYNPGDVVVELGAFLGYYALYAAQLIGPEGRILAVEFVPINFEILKVNLEANFPQTATAVRKGVYDKKSVRTARVGPHQLASFREDVVARFTAESNDVLIETDTVDNILMENGINEVDLMIIQVNGNEIEALRGMKESISRIRNFCIAAPYSRENTDHGAMITVFLSEHGFEVEVAEPMIYARRPG